MSNAMKVKRVIRIWIRMSATNIHLLQFKSLKPLVKNEMPVHQDSYQKTKQNKTKQNKQTNKLSKISNSAFAILPFY